MRSCWTPAHTAVAGRPPRVMLLAETRCACTRNARTNGTTGDAGPHVVVALITGTPSTKHDTTLHPSIVAPD